MELEEPNTHNSIIDKCVKCQGKFTNPEKPLKLLPCLHSMCTECLTGRIPIKPIVKSSDVPTIEKNDTLSVSNSCNDTHSTEDGSTQNVNSAAVEENLDSKDTDIDNEKTEGKNDSCEDSSNIQSPGKDAAVIESINSTDTKPMAEEKQGSTETPSSPPENNNSEEKSQIDNESINAVPEMAGTGSDCDAKEETPVDPIDEKPKPATECPICRDPIDQNLLDNMFAKLVPDKPLSPQDEIPHICTACEEGQEAPFYCMQCEEWLCDSCVDAHKRVRVTKDHSIVPKDEVAVATSKSPWEQQIMCKQHKQEELKFFCERCEKLTCRDCQLLDHKDHKYQFLDQAAEQYKQRLRGSLALMGEKRVKLAANRDEIEQKLKNCKEQKETLQQDILKQTDILVKGIRQAVWGVLGNLASFTDAANKRLNKEIDDVSDLVGKFDHCVTFMEDILREGSSMSLLYSKGNVETKCRKVYHTQVDPQSLKGTLSIQYKHDVNYLLNNLTKIGAIFVNGQRYPPDKNGRPGGGMGSSQPASGFTDGRAGLKTTSPHLQHMANQPVPGQRVSTDWNKYIQSVAKNTGAPPAAPPNMTMAAMTGGSLPPQLTLPSNRRGGPPPGIPNSTFPGHFVAGQLLTPQQQQQGAPPRPNFTPMRLHHRPATQNPFSTSNEHASAGVVPPRYNRQGSEASSGTSRPGHGTPDPARPASAGMYDNSGAGRPDSGGGSSMVDIKKERKDLSPDCVIMSTNIKSASVSPGFQNNQKQSETALEMQRNLDEVLRAVPMDLSENMEQISVSKPCTSVPSSSSVTSHSSIPHSNGAKTVKSEIHAMNGSRASEAPSPSLEELRENWQGGNSMPGFSLAQVDSQGDPNDDYCACCHNGGDVLCCDQCPRVFHLQCHVPEMDAVPNGSFLCTICEGDEPVDPEETSNGKRKAPGGLTNAEIKACERIILELYCHPSSIPFQEPVNKEQVPNYYKIIMQPMDFTQIKSKLCRQNSNHYQSVKSFLWDLRQVFINCAIYNKIGSEVGKAGKQVRAVFEALVGRLIPQYLAFVQEDPSPCFSALQKGSLSFEENSEEADGASDMKRPRLDGD